ncbi:hypothetical protein M4D71_16380 [Niallia taxi]|uniref:hypothetical protein n=1 Tax=Niallia taxi TaxID=2499688 RepID=UPI0021A56DCE|nr:hypothetical protein [Niallia taxi]MCT2345736.1 hypothetical protein [Niallia taxi]MED3961266.1 hypothetical protein [Niallia taxi]
MEKILVKTGIYSFIVSFFLLVIFKKREISDIEEEGWTSYTEIPYSEYFFTIFRYSIITSLFAVLFMLLYNFANKINHK